MLGATFAFKYLESHGIFAFCVMTNIDDANLLYFVPFDMNGFIGAHDLALNEHLTARCGRGFWIHTDDLYKFGNQTGGHVGDQNVSNVREKLAELVGATTEVRNPFPDEFSEAYEEWIEIVTSAVNNLEEDIRRIQ